jgi:hypothetical protein
MDRMSSGDTQDDLALQIGSGQVGDPEKGAQLLHRKLGVDMCPSLETREERRGVKQSRMGSGSHDECQAVSDGTNLQRIGVRCWLE